MPSISVVNEIPVESEPTLVRQHATSTVVFGNSAVAMSSFGARPVSAEPKRSANVR